MELGKNATLDFEGANVIVKVKHEFADMNLKIKSGAIINPKLDQAIADVQSGKLDLIKGTDFEKPIVIDMLQKLKSYLNGDAQQSAPAEQAEPEQQA